MRAYKKYPIFFLLIAFISIGAGCEKYNPDNVLPTSTPSISITPTLQPTLSVAPIPTITPTIAPIVTTEEKLNEYLCNDDEDILFSFKMAKTNKTASICISKNQPDYIVYRYGTKDNVELVYPEKKDAYSWNKFTYSYYVRGGGAENEGLDLNYLIFENGGYEYKIYDEYSSNDNLTKVGITVTELKTGNETEIGGESDSVYGSLIDLRENQKVKIEIQ